MKSIDETENQTWVKKPKWRRFLLPLAQLVVIIPVPLLAKQGALLLLFLLMGLPVAFGGKYILSSLKYSMDAFFNNRLIYLLTWALASIGLSQRLFQDPGNSERTTIVTFIVIGLMILIPKSTASRIKLIQIPVFLAHLTALISIVVNMFMPFIITG